MGLIGLNQALTVLSSSGSSTGESVSCPSWRLEVNRGASVVAQMVKNLPAMQEAWVQSLGQEDPLEKGMATHSSILAWRIPKTEKPGRLQSLGLQRVRHDWTHTHTHTHTKIILGAMEKSKFGLDTRQYSGTVTSHSLIMVFWSCRRISLFLMRFMLGI